MALSNCCRDWQLTKAKSRIIAAKQAVKQGKAGSSTRTEEQVEALREELFQVHNYMAHLILVCYNLQHYAEVSWEFLPFISCFKPARDVVSHMSFQFCLQDLYSPSHLCVAVRVSG